MNENERFTRGSLLLWRRNYATILHTKRWRQNRKDPLVKTIFFPISLFIKSLPNLSDQVSLVEIYNETVVDLLTTDAKVVDLKVAGNNIRIPNLTDFVVAEVKDIKHVMTMGDKNRSTASTKMNSTRSDNIAYIADGNFSRHQLCFQYATSTTKHFSL